MNTKYKHPEAFNLMQYRCENCNQREILWNSRDGVTPFCINCICCENGIMQHINWHNDVKLPTYKPINGQRIFVDFTSVRSEKFYKKYVDESWNRDKFPMHKSFSSKEEAVEYFVENVIEGEPCIITVGKDDIE